MHNPCITRPRNETRLGVARREKCSSCTASRRFMIDKSPVLARASNVTPRILPSTIAPWSTEPSHGPERLPGLSPRPDHLSLPRTRITHSFSDPKASLYSGPETLGPEALDPNAPLPRPECLSPPTRKHLSLPDPKYTHDSLSDPKPSDPKPWTREPLYPDRSASLPWTRPDPKASFSNGPVTFSPPKPKSLSR